MLIALLQKYRISSQIRVLFKGFFSNPELSPGELYISIPVFPAANLIIT